MSRKFLRTVPHKAPSSAGATARLLRRALHCYANGNLAAAETAFRGVLACDPRHADSVHFLGLILYKQGHIDQALETIAHSIVLDGSRADFYCNLGHILHEKGMADEAVAAYRHALHINPSFVDGHYNLGAARQAQGCLDEAAVHYREAIRLDPRHVEAHTNLGNILDLQDKPDAAIEHYRLALAARPGSPEVYVNWANILAYQNKLDDAIPLYQRGIALWQKQSLTPPPPAYVSAQMYLGMTFLLQGEFAKGLPLHEWRQKDKDIGGGYSGLTHPLWRGEPLEGARIVLHAEQGLGDTLQFLRYVPLVQRLGGEVMLVVQPSLRRLTSGFTGVPVYSHGDPMPPFDVHCPLMSLPFALHTEIGSIPADVPYLVIPEEEREAAAGRPWPSSGLRVGLVWAGSVGHTRDRHRSLSFSQVEPLLALEGIHFFSLQVGPAVAQIPAGSSIGDLGLITGNMADTAAKVAQMDLVIAVDTAVAHLAGALGVRTWLMLPFSPDWRWLLDRGDSPWYPTMQLFRQTKPRDWEGVVSRVGLALQDMINPTSKV